MMSFLPDDLEVITMTMSDGETRRFGECPWCGKGHRRRDFFVVNKFQTYYLLHCYKCHRTKRINNAGVSLSTIKKIRKQRDSIKPDEYVLKNDIQLPVDFTEDIPVEGMLWLNKYNITSDEKSTYNIGYSPMLDRVILPVYINNSLAYWQGRKLGELRGAPKYLNLKDKARRKVLFHIQKDSNLVVVVEDILSAIAVSRTGASAVALLGTNLPDSAQVVRDYETVILWLDPDKKQLSQQYAKRLRSFGTNAKAIVSHTKDPKEYTPEEINQYIGR